MKALHAKANALCRDLGAGNGRLALALCDGFGIPDHLLQARAAAGCDCWLRLCLWVCGVCSSQAVQSHLGSPAAPGAAEELWLQRT